MRLSNRSWWVGFTVETDGAVDKFLLGGERPAAFPARLGVAHHTHGVAVLV
jgi:hypothetical protein